MPLSEHEQRILEEIERRLAEEDPRLVESVARATVTSHALRRIRWGIAAFVLGFVLLMSFVVSVWVAVLGFVIMLASGLLVYTHLKRMGRDQLRSMERGGRLSVTAALARLAERFRKARGQG
jgi:ABC-type bacteriocin/lantibiotic exporter with double-glycine peptidase domain